MIKELFWSTKESPAYECNNQIIILYEYDLIVIDLILYQLERL